MALRDQPYFPLYVRDFSADEKLRNCSAESVGIYIMVMCFLHVTPKYGSYTLEDRQKKSDNNIENFAYVLLRQLPFEFEEIKRGLTQLIVEGVLTMDGDTIYQKRMVKDGEISEKRAIAGASGGSRTKNKEAKQKTNQKQNKSKTKAKDEQNTENEVVVVNEYENDSEDIRENVTPYGMVMDFFQNRFEPLPSEMIRACLKDYTDELGADVVLHAMQIALDEKKYGWSYTNGILKRYKADGLDSMAKVLQAEQDYHARKRNAPDNNGRRKAKAPGEYKGEDFIEFMRRDGYLNDADG